MTMTGTGCDEPDAAVSSNRCGAATVAHGLCLGHLSEDQRAQYLADLSPGAPIYARGVTFSGGLLYDLLMALIGNRECPEVGEADFRGATFTEWANFMGAEFKDHASFNQATFAEGADFQSTSFKDATFNEATFAKLVSFRHVTFRFVNFRGTRFSAKAQLRCSARIIDLHGAQVSGDLQLEAVADYINASELRATSQVSMRLRGARVDLSDAVFTASVAIHGFPDLMSDVADSGPTGPVSLTSLRGTDADRLVLTDVDLSRCLFSGMQNLDRLHLDGRCVFASDPRGTRQVLAEEHHWRARQSSRKAAAWRAQPPSRPIKRRRRRTMELPYENDPIPPARIEVLYRQLRKALEDAKNEPGAADFYYGEMEMRRSSAHGRSKLLLWLYWASSGYALRARRALSWLAVLIAIAVSTITIIGVPGKPTDLKASGTLTTAAGPEPVQIAVHQAKPITSLPARAENATEVTLNAVIFRSPDTQLTAPGRYIDIVVRILGPLLLGLSLLAIRNQVKR